MRRCLARRSTVAFEEDLGAGLLLLHGARGLEIDADRLARGVCDTKPTTLLAVARRFAHDLRDAAVHLLWRNMIDRLLIRSH